MECDINRGGIDNFFLMEIFNILDRYAEWSMIFILKWKIKERREERITCIFFIFFFLVANSSYNKDTRKRSIFNYRCLISILCFQTFQHTFTSVSFTESVSFEIRRNIPSPIIFILPSIYYLYSSLVSISFSRRNEK